MVRTLESKRNNNDIVGKVTLVSGSDRRWLITSADAPAASYEASISRHQHMIQWNLYIQYEHELNLLSWYPECNVELTSLYVRACVLMW
jgi:hypothetical protein